MDLTRQMQSQPYPPLGINPRMTDDSLSPIFDYHQKFLFLKIQVQIMLFAIIFKNGVF